MASRNQKARALTLDHRIEDLEDELIQRLYAMRSYEQKILSHGSESSVPESLRQAHAEAKVAFNQLEGEIRRHRYGY
jgi:hypothetical protein